MERRKILIVTKTYPSISTKYKETVCTAGLLLDNEDNPIHWIRIYPVRFRNLDFDKKYPRWSIISANIERNEKDYRWESYRIEDSSIQISRKLDTKNSWAERKKFILPLVSTSIREIQSQDRSLGIIKPESIKKYFVSNTEREWNSKQQAMQDQIDLFEPSVELEKIPYKFGYEFIDGDGDSHRYSISDWEIMQLYRNCRNSSNQPDLEGKEREALEKVRVRLEDEFLSKKDLYFVVGNLKDHKNNFMNIGLFYPPIVKNPQLSLL
jgi:hypothetical protein